MTTVDNKEKKLIDNPESLYYLYLLYTEGLDVQLPQIIDREHENKQLEKLGLITFVSKKSLHYNKTKLTEKGVTFIKELKEMGIWKIFSGIPTNSTEEFKDYYFTALNELKQSSSSSFVMEVLESTIREIQKNKKIQRYTKFFDVISYYPVKLDKNEEEWSYKIGFNCISCNKNSESACRVNYSLNENWGVFKIRCNNCGTEYMVCMRFNCFYKIS